MAIDPRRLSVLLAVQRAGGVVLAADLLGITASAISQQIARLESEVGQRVLDRNPGGAVLTPAGQTLARAAERIEAELEAAHLELLRHEGQVVGTVVVGAFQSAIRALLLPLLAQLPTALPGVKMVIREVWEDQGRKDLRRGALDLLILERDSLAPPPTPSGAVDVPLMDEPWYVVSPRVVGEPTSLADLADHRWLAAGTGTAAGRAMQRLQASLEMSVAHTHGFFDYDVALAMVSAGLGSALLPGLALPAQLPPSVLATHLPGLGVRRLAARYRSTAGGLTPAQSALLELLIARAASLSGGRAEDAQ
ncbi:LysR family transcriptional regulator [Buchananella felis]|uniref:LysR family transcriptional regulator n=1 Tax=Buchananella felis TaxID=3231492 RepID=UPI003526F4F3